MILIKRIINLTGKNFERVNFEEAELIEFICNDKLPIDLKFSIWGVRLLFDDFWKHDKTFLQGISHSQDYYVAGIGKIMIQQVNGIDFHFFPYKKTSNSYQFVYDELGQILDKGWSKGKLEGGDNYLWECVQIHPHGFCRLNIYAYGDVEYEFDDVNIIPEKDFLERPNHYAYHI